MAGESVADALGVALESGLPEEEIRKRRKTYGPNRLREKKQASAWRILVDQFKSLIIAILAAASVPPSSSADGWRGSPSASPC